MRQKKNRSQKPHETSSSDRVFKWENVGSETWVKYFGENGSLAQGSTQGKKINKTRTV